MFVLKKIGKILHYSKTGNIIVLGISSSLPEIKDEVFNKKLEKIGYVYDIIGPVDSPYIVVKPTVDRFVDEDSLFVVVENGRGGKGKGKGDFKKGSRKGSRKKGSRKRRSY